MKKTIQEIKKEMLMYTDLLGFYLLDRDKINKCKTKQELKEIIDIHRYHLDCTVNDAIHNLDKFKKELGL